MSDSYKYIDPGFTYIDPADNTTVYTQYMQGTINGDIELLSQLIFDQINKSNLK
jgi:hypothetical protein